MNINLKDLTQEQIADLRNQLAELDKPSHFTDIKSWEDAFDKVNPEYSVTHYDGIKQWHSKYDPMDKDYCSNHIPSETHAKSILASCKLMVIAEALNEGWKPDWSNRMQWKYLIQVDYLSKTLNVEFIVRSGYTKIYFKSKELAEYCAKQFNDLWYDYFMVENV